MEKKMTQKEMFNEIIKFAQAGNRQDIVEFCQSRIAVLDKKSENRTQTKTQKENAELAKIILEVLKGSNPMTVTEMQNKNEVLGSLSNQKVSAILRNMVKEGTVTKDTSTKKTLFSERGITVAVELE